MPRSCSTCTERRTRARAAEGCGPLPTRDLRRSSQRRRTRCRVLAYKPTLLAGRDALFHKKSLFDLNGARPQRLFLPDADILPGTTSIVWQVISVVANAFARNTQRTRTHGPRCRGCGWWSLRRIQRVAFAAGERVELAGRSL